MLRKLLLATTALVCLGGPADAGPVVAAVQAVSAWVASLSPLAAAAVKIGASVILNLAVGALTRKSPRQQDVIRELHQPTSLPAYRFVYGKCWAPGTPAPVRVKGRILYGCFILNSRPSAGPFTLYLDKRKVEATGNPYDFAGNGAKATNDPFENHTRYWIGRGDQVSPPAQFLSEAGDIFKATDGWRGRTVLWLRADVGDNDDRQERWPATPPEVMVDGRWSLVRDPRNPSAPAAWSANQALCVLDALRKNPLRPYDDRNLWLETFAWAADEADVPFPVKGGGTIPRFETNGVLVFSQGQELEDTIIPLVEAGASEIIRVGGRLGLVPAVWQEPVMTVSDVLDDQPMTFNRNRPLGELVTEVTATYTSPERMYEDATTPVYVLDGAQQEDGGLPRLGQYDLGFVTDHRQAQYVAAIMGRRTRMQRSWSGVLPGDAFDLVAASVMSLQLPAPYTRRNGTYKVESIHPGFDPVGQDGVAMRCPAMLREESPAIYAWNPETDEQDITLEDFDPTIKGLQPPGAVTGISDASTVLTSGDTSIPRIRFEADPSPSASAISYEWQYQRQGEPWQAGGTIDGKILDADGDVFGYVAPVVVGQPYRVRMRTLGPGTASKWVESALITASAGGYLAPAPTPVSAVGGAGQIAVTFRAPNDPDYRAMEIWQSATNNSTAAALMAGPVYGAPNSAVTEVHTGLGAGQTRYYFARSIDRNGQPSPFSASISATTT
ncbi:MAG: hypothetical protein FJX25_02515 [Alphaproteobacteria bacterium]|nr:hypothetical protein [Alphaproteobacteria bacterium]